MIDLTGIEPTKKKKTITPQELEIVIEALKNRTCKDSFKNDSMVIALYIGYYSGLRLSEALALEKNDFDFINNEIHVNKQLDCIGKHVNEIKTTTKLKTTSSSATIPLAEPLKEKLVDWFKINPYSRVICDVEGNYINDCFFATTLKGISQKTGIYFHFHMLRHTFVSNLANNGVEPQIAKELARHSNINTTMNVYTHINEDSQRHAINSVFGQKSVKKVSNASLLLN